MDLNNVSQQWRSELDTCLIQEENSSDQIKFLIWVICHSSITFECQRNCSFKIQKWLKQISRVITVTQWIKSKRNCPRITFCCMKQRWQFGCFKIPSNHFTNAHVDPDNAEMNVIPWSRLMWLSESSKYCRLD